MQKNPNTLFVGICGGSGSGKSHFLEKILVHYPADKICLISQDDYYRPIEEQIPDENGIINFDRPESFNEPLLFDHICQILGGNSVQKAKYTFNNPALKSQILEYKPSPITIIEGIFVFYYKRIAELMDIKLFIDSDEKIGLKRRISRDGPERALSSEEVLYQWNNHVIPSYQNYSLPFRKEADLVIHNSEKPLDIQPLIHLINQRIQFTNPSNEHR